MSIDTSGGHSDMDYAQHVDTYATFLRLTKITILAVVAIVAGMFYFLV